MKIGIYVDAENIAANGGFHMRYSVLRDFARRGGGEIIRLNTYVAYDEQRAEQDPEYRTKKRGYMQALRQNGWKVVAKPVQRFRDEDGTIHVKANADLDLAVDALRQGKHLDYVLLLTGDGDFARVVDALQDDGCRVELLAFDNVSRLLRERVDGFHSGYLIPGLLGFRDRRDNRWGESGHRVRGVCTHWHEDGYGFFRFLKTFRGDLWNVNTDEADSPYGLAFVHQTELPAAGTVAVQNRENIFEFTLADQDQGRAPPAKDVRLVSGS